MKNLSYYPLVVLIILLFTACQENDEAPATTGAFSVEFDNYVGDQAMQLDPVGDTNYRYTTGAGQAFNLSTFRYYISGIRLEGPDGTVYEDNMNVSPDADQVKGYYLVQESEAYSHFVSLKDVPAGQYNKITFTLGIPEEGMSEGAGGGILDPAEGAWFWNWNAGYINLGIEGTAAASAQQKVEGDGFTIEPNTFALHVGGWKEVDPSVPNSDRFVNNIRTVTLDFGTSVTVSDDLKPEAHVVLDVLQILDGAKLDFSQTYSVHSPKPGQAFADQIPTAFSIDHVHQ
ncbi:MAG: MbnP family protein [Tunicatimonas sp.]